ncbi:MAG TPA: glycosyltransferase family 4 protein [Terriglobales bacterium]|jgi:glycosyltransferase involved in cell wall biosynthesis|nr:glycosyltransferase family 4 protein [Terriglobales bacterium]
MIKVFTPSYADAEITNAQALTVKEIVARLPPDRFRVLMLCKGAPDCRLTERSNTEFLPWLRHGNAVNIFTRCMKFQPDIYFYPHAGPLDSALFWSKRKFRSPAAIVSHVVSGSFDDAILRPTMVRMVRQSDAVFGNNSYLSSVLEKRTGTKIRTIHNGINRKAFFPAENRRPGGSSLRALYAGSFRPYKRVDVVVRAAAVRPNVEFRLAGIGEELDNCRKLAHELNCQNISFIGHLSQSELGEEMRSADVFFFPSEVEGHPQVLGQAAACGLPSVALDRYHADYVINGRTGFLAGSHEEMGTRLSELLGNPELRCSMSKAAIEHAGHFDWDEITRQWQSVFEEVVARRRRD